MENEITIDEMDKKIREMFFDNIYVNPKYIKSVYSVTKSNENFTYYFWVYLLNEIVFVDGEELSYLSIDFDSKEEANENRDLLIDYITKLNEVGLK